MKKLFYILGASLLITACGEAAKTTTANKNKVEAEVKQEILSTVATPSKQETLSTVEAASKHEIQNNLDTVVKGPASDNIDLINQEVTNTENQPKQVLQQDKPLTSEHSAEIKEQNIQPTESKKTVNKQTYTKSESIKLSAEERRVLSQTPALTDEEIKYEKMQCRYPFMTEQEKRENHCYNM